MSASLILSSGAAAINDNLTRFLPIFGGLTPLNTESDSELTIRQPGQFSKLFTYVISNTASVTTTVTLRKNRTDTALTLSYTADQTGIKEDTVNSVSFSAEDEIDYEVTVPNEAGTNTFTLQITGMMLTPDNAANCVSFLGTGANTDSITAASATRFLPATGSLANTTTESLASWRSRGAFTARDFQVNVTANARTTDTTFTSRKNAAAGALTVTYTSGQTGVKEDNSNTDSISVDDDINFAVITGTGTEVLTLRSIYYHLVSTIGQFPLINQDVNGEAVAVNLTRFLACAGNMSNGFLTSEVDTQIYPRFTFTAKELTANVTANTISLLDTTITLRDNGADSALVLTYAAGETGIKSDSVNSVEITADTDEIDYEVTTPVGGTSIVFRFISVIGEITAVANPFIINLDAAYV